MDFSEGLEIQHKGDLPSRTGIGSSSSFTVGLIKALSGLRGQIISKQKLAEAAVHIDQKIVNENVGCQDHFAAAFGGLKFYNFTADGGHTIEDVILTKERKLEFESHLLLFYTGISRTSSIIAKNIQENIPQNISNLLRMKAMVLQAKQIIQSSNRIEDFGELLHEAWMHKTKLSAMISNPLLNDTYARARECGAMGEKLLGAGGGGFFLFFAPPRCHPQIIATLSDLLYVPIKLEASGSEIVYYDDNDSMYTYDTEEKIYKYSLKGYSQTGESDWIQNKSM